MLVRRIDNDAIERLKRRARDGNTSVEALARDAIHRLAELTTAEKLALARNRRSGAEKRGCRELHKAWA